MNVQDIVQLNSDFQFEFPNLLIVEIDGDFAVCLCEGGGSARIPTAMLTPIETDPPTLTSGNIHVN